MKACLEVIEPFLKFSPDINLREMKWMDWVQQEMQGGFGITSKIYHHHISFIFGHGVIDTAFVDTVLRLLKAAQELLANKTIFPVLADDGCSKSSVHFLWDHIGGQTSTKRSDETAFFWREGEYVANIKLSWSHPSQSSHMIDFEQRCKSELAPFTLQHNAAYLNYIDDTQVKWQEAYYGGNYDRLTKIKKKWDPNNFWWFPQAIGESGRDRNDKNEDDGAEPPKPGKIPKRWEEFSVKDPSVIDSAGDSIRGVLRANLEARKKQWQF